MIGIRINIHRTVLSTLVLISLSAMGQDTTSSNSSPTQETGPSSNPSSSPTLSSDSNSSEPTAEQKGPPETTPQVPTQAEETTPEQAPPPDDSFSYWEIQPVEPRIRWAPSKNSETLTDWQVGYRRDGENLTIGSIELNPTSPIWKRAKTDGPCRSLATKLAFDQSQISLCTSDETDYESKLKNEINGQTVEENGTILLTEDKPMDVIFRFEKKKYLKMSLKAPRLEPIDIVYSKEKWNMLLQDKTRSTRSNSWWGATFPFKEKLYRVTLDTNESLFPLKGIAGLTYKRLFMPPANKEAFVRRPVMGTKKSIVTYKEEIKVPVLIPSENKKYKRGTWIAKNLQKGKWNEQTEKFGDTVMNYSVLRMPKYEASTRLSFLKPAGSNIAINAELAILGFLENPIKDESSHFLTHRLGWRARMTQMVSGSSDIELKLMQAEARYFLKPGLWNYDEVWGGIVSGYSTQFSGFSMTSPGVGIFWARSLPEVFDRMLRWVPIFRYPKYTDLDFNYIMGPNGAAGSYVLNFHGKMFLPNNLYFEAGLGFVSFSFKEGRRSKGIEAFTGTIGLGYMF